MTQKRVNRLESLGKSERRVKLPGAAHGPANWRLVNVATLVDTITTVSVAGGAIRLGYTRDGGAYAVGVYGDGDPYTIYCGSDQSIEDVLRSICDGFDIIGNSAPTGNHRATPQG